MRTALAALALLVGCYSPPGFDAGGDGGGTPDAGAWELCDGCDSNCPDVDPAIPRCDALPGMTCPAECLPRCLDGLGRVMPDEPICGVGTAPSCGSRASRGCYRPL